ncbi:hypothetical protein A2W24_01610 [Microgenomates group bacterium RBG_16_45_19]|nr:MAG: hypothetical protein A2W24_01610 [Microgenomates group bacterium RBG_16_45_19]
MGYRAQAISGLKWIGSYRILMRLLSIVRTAVLARLLTPAQFGVFGVATIVLGLLEMSTETGINVFLIQQAKQNALKQYLNTAWVISIMRGLLIALLIFITAPLVVVFFRSPDSLSILWLMAFIPLIRGFINPAIIAFQRNLAFKSEFLFRSGLLVTDALVAVIIALTTRSAISLVWGMIASALLEVVLSFIIPSLKPRFHFRSAQVRTILHQGKWVTVSGVFAYFSGKTPDIIIGRQLPAVSLGFYQMAYRLAIIPFEEAMETFNKVAFPVYSKFADDRERLVRAVKQNYLAVTSLIIPIILVIFLFARPLTLIILGDQWLAIVPLMRILSLAGVLLVLGALTDPIYLSRQRQDYLSLINLIRLGLIVGLAIPFTLWWGPEGSAYALLISLSLILPLRFYYALKALSAPVSGT